MVTGWSKYYFDFKTWNLIFRLGHSSSYSQRLLFWETGGEKNKKKTNYKILRFSFCNIGLPKQWRKRDMSKSFITSRGRYPNQITSSVFNFPGWCQPATEDAFTRVCAPWQFRCSTKFTKRLESRDATSYCFAGMHDSNMYDTNGCCRYWMNLVAHSILIAAYQKQRREKY